MDENSDVQQRAKLENAVLRKYVAIKQATEDVVGTQKIYVDITGDYKAALVLDEIMFFTLPRKGGLSALRVWKDGYLWMAVQRNEWWERKRLTPRQADRAVEKLESLDLVVKDVFKFGGSPTVHLRLNIPVFFKKYGEALETMTPTEDVENAPIQAIAEMLAYLENPFSPFGNLPNGETKLPNGDTKSPNGEIFNIPHTSLTSPVAGEPPAQPPSWLGFEQLKALKGASGPLDDKVNDFPEDCQTTLRWFVEIWKWPAASIPSKPAKGKGGGAYAQWITEIRAVNQVIAGYGKRALLACVKPCEKLTISHPAAIAWCLPGEVGKLTKSEDVRLAQAPQTPFTQNMNKRVTLKRPTA